MENTWMPKVAGIMDIVAGSFGVILACIMTLWFAFIFYFIPMGANEFNDFPMRFMSIFMIFWGVFILAAGIIAIVGGIHALRKKRWGLALAGSIAAFFGSSPLGVAAIIFTAMGKNQFE
jgi:hypothetical protein